MKFFIDSADVKEIREAKAMGLVDGVTTNPTLVAKSGRDFRELLVEITNIIDGPISAEVVALDAEGMIREGKDLAAIHKNIVVKVPMTAEGLKATLRFSEMKIRTNVTLCFSSVQALLAAKAGATYISPFIGRLDDVGEDGMKLIEEIRRIYDNYKMKTEILAASIRGPQHVRAAALIGADVATCPFKTLLQLSKHPLTDLGLEAFLKDWNNRK
jgi:transaldolase